MASSMAAANLPDLQAFVGKPIKEICSLGYAIDNALATKPNLILLDLSMPVMNGLTAARILKSLLPDARLILFTLHADILNSEETQACGFSAVVSKNDAWDLIPTAERLLKAVA